MRKSVPYQKVIPAEAGIQNGKYFVACPVLPDGRPEIWKRIMSPEHNVPGTQ